MFDSAVNSILDGLALVSGVHPLVLPVLVLLPMVPILAHYAQQAHDAESWTPTHTLDPIDQVAPIFHDDTTGGPR